MDKGIEVLSVIIPVYNEESTVSEVLNILLLREEVGEIIIVNDGSTDSTAEVLKKFTDNPKIKIISQDINQGKGSAIRKGFDLASYDIVIVQDADLEYTPDDYPIILNPILTGKADVVYGSRFQGGPGRVLYYKHQLGNKFITFLSNIFSDLNFTDVETCYKAFKREVIQNIIFETKRFGIEIEITAKLSKAEGLKIYEVPISYHGRTYSDGKKITWKDGFAALWYILKFNLFTSKSSFYKKPWNKVLLK